MLSILEPQDCCGCHACYSICPKSCITMRSDSEGFWYPQIDQMKCINCGSCERVCPIIHKTIINNNPQAYAAYNIDENNRMQSSSGGIFTLLAENIIARGGVVFGAGFDNEFQVVHSCAETRSEIKAFRGSKYVQSKIGETYKQVRIFLDVGRLVLFSGTPCQISGLKSYMGKEYDNLFCQDIICHGVPSPKVWKNYVAYREGCSGTPVGRISFREKNESWKRYSVSFLFNDDTEYRETFDKDLMMQGFLKNIYLRPSCYHCCFKGVNRQSDITLADFWGIENVLPELFDDKGTSLIFLNSQKGQDLFQQIDEKMIFCHVDIKKAVSYNPSAFQSSRPSTKRDAFFKDLDKLPFEALMKKYCVDSYYTKARHTIHRFLSKVKHIFIK
ncbi:Coenzyme F420 hydrogenase/dehydrogenase, beta subunit C-terminal domain [Caproiciproducens faecalis]|uniref:Coenzyme F420 hydrogenase/dehydrogenase, beta subunit C-terminal domain n=1 Tax=Caproiciproducens faecalis TaxID=2820301 RepID=A0ABS7DL36_9FIRM|nr:Coenzyme F420 hydrogenase/dehydrogenase, beta subunit C-terminal domain [Caproiciproducens faecalis]MBW7571983.1 Coenzyme F420 hydrogenase/dehydrogenase, beta subunit C-terminal domain [Caproiciproducens faecalis]